MADIDNNSGTNFNHSRSLAGSANRPLHLPDTDTYDYIIVGAGTAGCVIARRLLEGTNARVLLLEAGGSHKNISSLESPTRWPENLFTAYDYAYKYEPSPYLNNRVLDLNRGKVLGGSGSINFMVWARGNKFDYDDWAAAGNKGWDYQSVLPLFKKIEDWEDGATDFHGAGGPIGVQRAKNIHIGAQALLEGAKAFGLPFIDDTNGPSAEGVGFEVMNVKDGLRSSPATGYLEPVLEHKNLTLITEAKVLGLNFEGTRCTGLNFVKEGLSYTVKAATEVVLCAGAVDTPRILMLSGIGDAAELKAVGLTPLINLPGVGKNLQDHIILKGLCFEAEEPLAPKSNNLLGSAVYWKSHSSLRAADLMILSPQAPVLTPQIAEKYPPVANCFTIAPSLLNIQSRGYLKLKNARHDGPLEIQPNFLDALVDLEAMIKGVELSIDIVNQPEFKQLIKRSITPTHFKNRAAIVDFIKNSATSYLHTACTCAMGTGEHAVVNDQLLVYGTVGLRIADASVMPKITSGNTHAPTLMIGEFAAQLMIAGAN